MSVVLSPNVIEKKEKKLKLVTMLPTCSAEIRQIFFYTNIYQFLLGKGVSLRKMVGGIYTLIIKESKDLCEER